VSQPAANVGARLASGPSLVLAEGLFDLLNFELSELVVPLPSSNSWFMFFVHLNNNFWPEPIPGFRYQLQCAWFAL